MWHQAYTADKDFISFSLPTHPHVWTVYSRLGFSFKWFCVVAALIYWGAISGMVPPVLFDSSRTGFDARTTQRQLSRTFSRQYSRGLQSKRLSQDTSLFGAAKRCEVDPTREPLLPLPLSSNVGNVASTSGHQEIASAAFYKERAATSSTSAAPAEMQRLPPQHPPFAEDV